MFIVTYCEDDRNRPIGYANTLDDAMFIVTGVATEKAVEIGDDVSLPLSISDFAIYEVTMQDFEGKGLLCESELVVFYRNEGGKLELKSTY